MVFDNIPLLQGLVGQYVPRIIKGAMREYLGEVKFAAALDWVKSDKSLWEALPENSRKAFCDFAPKLGPVDWLTCEWVIDAARESNPGLSSLFCGWPEGQVWLERQIIDIKSKIKGGEYAGAENNS